MRVLDLKEHNMKQYIQIPNNDPDPIITRPARRQTQSMNTVEVTWQGTSTLKALCPLPRPWARGGGGQFDVNNTPITL
jgi:hypothetical protein